MKKLLITTAIATMFTAPIFAETLLLQGTVAPVLSVTVTPVASVHDDLDLSASPTDLKVASVLEESNSINGYKIFAKSTTGGTLANGALDSIAYTIGYGGGAHVSLTTADQEVKDSGTGGLISATSDVDVAYTGKAATALVAGTYSDTVTISIVTK